MQCRHCAGRGFRYEEDGPCYVCHGKKRLISEDEVREYFERIRQTRELRVIERSSH